MATVVSNGDKSNLWMLGLAIFASLFSAASWLTPRGDLREVETRLQVEIDAMRKILVPVSVHETYQKGIEHRLDMIESNYREMRGVVVRRIELDGRLRMYDDRLAVLREGIGEIRSQFTGSANIGKAIDALNQHLIENDRRLNELISRLPATREIVPGTLPTVPR